MNVKWGSVASSIFTFLLLVALPNIAIRMMPPEILTQIQGAGFDTTSLVMQLSVIGLVTSVITLVKGIVDPTSLAYLVVSLVSSSMYFLFMVLFLGLGNISNLGAGNTKYTTGPIELLIGFDFRFFIWVSVAAILLQMMQVYFEWTEARSDAASKAEPTKPGV